MRDNNMVIVHQYQNDNFYHYHRLMYTLVQDPHNKMKMTVKFVL